MKKIISFFLILVFAFLYLSGALANSEPPASTYEYIFRLTEYSSLTGSTVKSIMPIFESSGIAMISFSFGKQNINLVTCEDDPNAIYQLTLSPDNTAIPEQMVAISLLYFSSNTLSLHLIADDADTFAKRLTDIASPILAAMIAGETYEDEYFTFTPLTDEKAGKMIRIVLK